MNQVDELSGVVDKHHSSLQETVQLMDSRLTDADTQQDGALAATMKSVRGEISGLQEAMVDEQGRAVTTKQILQTVAETNEQQDLRVGEISQVVAQQVTM